VHEEEQRILPKIKDVYFPLKNDSFCGIKNCGSWNSYHCSLYELPKDKTEKKRWLTAIKAFQGRVSGVAKVCQRHFHASDFEDTKKNCKYSKYEFTIPANFLCLKVGSIPRLDGKVFITLDILSLVHFYFSFSISLTTSIPSFLTA